MPILLIVIGTTVWVGSDASGRDWRKANRKTVFAKSAAGWVLGCLLLWIVVFPLYLAQRSSAPRIGAFPARPDR